MFESQVSEEKSGNSHTSTTGQDEEVQEEVYINTGADYEAILDHYLQVDDAPICENINNQVIYDGDDENTNDKNN